MKAPDLTRFLILAIKAGLQVLIVGEPGIGKTDIVKLAAKHLGYDIVIMHPAISDPTDFKGFPAIIDGKAVFLAFNELKQLIDAGKPLICFIDDIGQAAHAVQAALMQLLLARQLNDHKLSDHVVFVGATNDTSHRAGVHGLLEPVKSRWHSIIHLEPDFDSWRDWAYKANVSPMLINFFRFRPSLLNNFKPTAELTNSPSPRTASAVSKWLKAIPNDDVLLMQAIEGAAGSAFAVEFTAFLKVFRSLPDVQAILRDPNDTAVPDKQDVQYALVGALIAATTKPTLANCIKFLARMGKEFEVYGVTDLVRKEPSWVNTKEFTDWGIKNSSVVLGLA